MFATLQLAGWLAGWLAGSWLAAALLGFGGWILAAGWLAGSWLLGCQPRAIGSTLQGSRWWV